MDEMKIDLEAEIAQVREELVSFRDVCLPAFFVRGGLPDRASPSPGPVGLTSQGWARLSDGLLEALPHGGRAGRLELDDYSFLHVITEPSYSVDRGRIAWHCEGFFPIYSSDDHLGYIRSLMGGETNSGNDRDALIAQLPDWFLALAVDDTLLWNALSSTLPMLVDPKPQFVRRLLDPETWRDVVRGRPGLTEEDRAGNLECIDGAWFGHTLNNALLYVLGTVANNRHGLLPEFPDHPNLSGRYTHLMPHYLLGVLLAKVLALRTLAGVDEGRREEGPRLDPGDGHGEAEVREPAP
jgi:hypothetical protein